MKNTLNFKSVATGGILLAAIALGGCNKEQMGTRGGANQVSKGEVLRSITLNQDQSRIAKEAYHKLPKMRFWDEANQRFIEMSNSGNRELNFADPDAGFTFDDPDNNGVMLFSDDSGDYIVFSSGFGVAGQGGGGGVVVAGNSALNIDIAVCISAQAVADGDGFGDIFNTGFAFDEYAAVFGIAGDFEALQDADTQSDDFNPFDYFHGFATYYVLADETSGSHEVFDWLGAHSDDDFEDMASSFVMDFTNFSLYFSTSGTIEVSGGQMNFNGEYLAVTDLFESFLDDDFDQDDIQANIVTGFGTMGCN